MIYNVLRQGPNERSIASHFPLINEPWVVVGSIESDKTKVEVWDEAIQKVVGKSLASESDRGIWYIVEETK